AVANGKMLKMNLNLLILPAFLDFISALFHYVALNFIPGSVYGMLRGGTILTTFLFSTTIMKSKLSRHRVLGAVLVVVGLGIVGAVNYFLNGQTTRSSSDTVVGYFLIFLSLITNGLLF
ncbi:unnamed protein product, partial [Sphagnum balticum]